MKSKWLWSTLAALIFLLPKAGYAQMGYLGTPQFSAYGPMWGAYPVPRFNPSWYPMAINTPYGWMTPQQIAYLRAEQAARMRMADMKPLADSISAKFLPNDKFQITWNGDLSRIGALSFSLLDAHDKPLDTKKITKMPAQVQFSIKSKAANYQVVIQYRDGSSFTITSAL